MSFDGDGESERTVPDLGLQFKEHYGAVQQLVLEEKLSPRRLTDLYTAVQGLFQFIHEDPELVEPGEVADKAQLADLIEQLKSFQIQSEIDTLVTLFADGERKTGVMYHLEKINQIYKMLIDIKLNDYEKTMGAIDPEYKLSR